MTSQALDIHPGGKWRSKEEGQGESELALAQTVMTPTLTPLMALFEITSIACFILLDHRLGLNFLAVSQCAALDKIEKWASERVSKRVGESVCTFTPMPVALMAPYVSEKKWQAEVGSEPEPISFYRHASIIRSPAHFILSQRRGYVRTYVQRPQTKKKHCSH